MTIHHFNTYLTGGAAIAARRIHDALIAAGVDSRFYFGSEAMPPEDQSYFPYTPGAKPKNILDKLNRQVKRWRYRRKVRLFIQQRASNSDVFTYSKLHYSTPRPQNGHPPDVIHLHWIADFLDYPSFFSSIPANLPVVWTLLDMNPFTGGCHYAWDCAKFNTTCNNCPQLSRAADDDMSAENFAVKRAAFDCKDIHVVGASHWIETQARESALLGGARSFRTIHCGVDAAVFRPLDREGCRASLGLPANSFIICFGAEIIHLPRKGGEHLLDALTMLRKPHGALCLIFGDGTLPIRPDLPPLRMLGSVREPERLAQVYSAADLFVIPSLQENLAQTMLEAMACGTPVVGFDTGGIPEAVLDHDTGLIAKLGDRVDLAGKIQWMLDHPHQRAEMGARSRKLIVSKFTIEQQARKYAELYGSIINPSEAMS